jgi:uncharacterized protein YndB with AHSA1/START domain
LTSVTLVRHIKARPAIVFEAMTTPLGISTWWGPDGGPVLVAECDARTGGRFRVRFRMLDGLEYESSGEFLEIDAPTSFRMTWRWTAGMPDFGSSLVEARLRAIDEGTELTFTHSQFPDSQIAQSHEAGWAGAFGKLVQKFAEGFGKPTALQTGEHLP